MLNIWKPNTSIPWKKIQKDIFGQTLKIKENQLFFKIEQIFF